MVTIKPLWAARLGLVVFAVSFAASLPVSHARAQVVMGQVVDSISGTSVGTGFVVLIDQEDREVARTLSAGDGRFMLDAPAGGLYRLRSERIGYQAFTSAPFELGPRQTLEHTLRVRAQAIVLAAVQVQGEDRCNTNPSEAVETGVVWQEIRKALAATTWDGTQELARYRRYGYTRELDLRRERVVAENGSVVEGFASQPFRSIPAAQLAREGYVVERPDGTWYNLPDAGVLQDDEFLATHCFHVVRDSLRRPGQIGLAFEPMDRRRALPDVRGALWLDETTSELRVLDVSFTQLPEGVRHERAGGTLEFLKLPSGAWIVHRWQVRKPMIRVTTAGNRVIVEGRNRRTAIVGFNDTGADVLEITTNEGQRLYPPGVAHLTGTVYDSTRGVPLADALVSLEGTSLWGRSDASGGFHLTAPFEGNYSAVLSHARIDSVGYSAPAQDVFLWPDDTVSVSFAIPHADSIARRLCSYSATTEFGTVVGLIRDGNSGRPAAGTQVRASWQVLSQSDSGLSPNLVDQAVLTNEFGAFALCGLPVGVPLTVAANGARSASIIFPKNKDGRLLFARDRDPSKEYTRSFETTHRTWKVDLLLTNAPPARSSQMIRPFMSGYVTDRATGLPLEGVVLSLNGTDSTQTRRDGTFDLIGVEWLHGTNYVATRRLGYAPWGQEIWLEEGAGPLELSVQLLPQAISVDPVEVTAEAVEQVLTDVGFYARQRVNAGFFMEREQIERKLGSAMYVTELLTGVAGIEVVDAMPGQIGSSIFFRGIGSIERTCGPPRTYVDGVPVEFEVLEMLVRPEDVLAIEAYRRPSEIPTEYRGANSACGVMLIWTKRGG